MGRRVNRTEVAKRVANIDNYHIKQLCNQWFYDAEPSFTNWGPIETTTAIGSYKYFKINTMSTVTNAHHSLFNWIGLDIEKIKNSKYIYMILNMFQYLIAKMVKKH